MDPIHPIVPQPPNIPPVTPAPTAGPIDRDSRRRREQEEQKQRRRSEFSPEDELAPEEPGEDEQGPGAHIDVTA
jgi:hypothetical protein